MFGWAAQAGKSPVDTEGVASFPMKQQGGKFIQISSAGSVRLRGYARPRRRVSPWVRLATMALIVITVAIAAVFRHLSHRSGDGQPSAAASLQKGPDGSRPGPASSPSPTLSTPAVSASLLVDAKPAVSVAPPQRPSGNATAGPALNTTPHATTKPLQPKAVPAPSSSPPASSAVNGNPPIVRAAGGRRYHVQVGALADRVGAEELAGRLRILGYAVRIVGAKPFHVWVGGYLDEPTAGRLITNLRGQGFDAVLSSEEGHPL
jgi:cell division septation protein DedD